jgi:hypothetical protein
MTPFEEERMMKEPEGKIDSLRGEPDEKKNSIR